MLARSEVDDLQARIVERLTKVLALASSDELERVDATYIEARMLSNGHVEAFGNGEEPELSEPLAENARVKAIAKKIRKAKTDPDPLPETLDGLDGRPEARNLVNIYAALANAAPQAVLDQHAGALFGHFKMALADLAVAKMAPISGEMTRLMADPAEIDRILGRGAARARAITAPILARTYDIVGMLRS